MAALGIHEDRIHDERIAFPLPPWAFRATGQIGRVATFEHDALDRIGIGARAGRGWILPGGDKISCSGTIDAYIRGAA